MGWTKVETLKTSSANITDATAAGRSVLTASSAAAARSAIGAGTSSLTLGTTSTTALAGNAGGAPLATVFYGPSTGASYALSASLVPLNSTYLTVAFTATTSAVDVAVTVTLKVPAGTPSGALNFQMIDHTSLAAVGNCDGITVGGISTDLTMKLTLLFRVTGLAAGSSYHYDLGAQCQASATGALVVAGTHVNAGYGPAHFAVTAV